MKSPENIQGVDCPWFGASFFQNLSDPERKILLDGAKLRHYRKRQNVFQEGDTPSGIFYLQRGKVKIYKIGIRGQPLIIRLAKSGDLIGYRTLLGEEPYSATAEVLEETEIYFIKKEAFLHVFRQNPVLLQQMIRRLCLDLHFAENHLIDFVQKSARQRVAETLLFLQISYGRPYNKNILIDISLSRREIAEFSGVVLETAVRFLNEFKKKNWLRFERKKIIILDKEALNRTASPIY